MGCGCGKKNREVRTASPKSSKVLKGLSSQPPQPVAAEPKPVKQIDKARREQIIKALAKPQ